MYEISNYKLSYSIILIVTSTLRRRHFNQRARTRGRSRTQSSGIDRHGFFALSLFMVLHSFYCVASRFIDYFVNYRTVLDALIAIINELSLELQRSIQNRPRNSLPMVHVHVGLFLKCVEFRPIPLS